MRASRVARQVLLCGVGLLLVGSAVMGQEPAPATDPMTLPSPDGAFKRSMLCTVLPLPTLVLSLPGIIVGPSTGFFYGGKPGRAWGGIGLRVAAVGGMMSSFAICGWDCGPGDDSYDLAWMVFGASGALLVGSAIYDIATVRGAVRERNSERQPALMSLSPAYSLRTRTVGLRLWLTF